ncbi:MAG: porin [Verrucomicrobia bacterium]|nr:porin [Verrucomicrobiota bacterium]
MKIHRSKWLSLLLGSCISLTSALAAQPSTEELLAMIEAQQKQINALKALVAQNQSGVSQAKEQVEATALAVESIDSGAGAARGWWEKTSVGGYGELHANFRAEADNELDFHRFVLFLNHDYNDWISLYSELELEHSIAGEDQPGEIELEQAFVRLDWTDQFSTDVGLFIIPIGILNETHEPDTFYGVERNSLEKYIIPTTWWQGGVRGHYRFENGVSVEAAITDGLNTDDGYIRGGRQKVAKAVLNEAAISGRLRYTGIPGLDLGCAFFYQNDLNQGTGETSGLLKSFHAIYQKGGFGLRALYADWDLSGAVAAGAESQGGYYIEPSYRWNAFGKYGDLGAFVRYSEYEYFKVTQLEKAYTTFGFNYWPTAGVVLKADLQKESAADDYDLNLGFGYQF